MIRKILVALVVVWVSLFATAHLALADAKGSIQCGVNAAAGSGDVTSVCPAPATDSGDSITKLITSVINILCVLVGAVAVIMIIVGGFRYVTSSGNEQAISGAKKTIIYALVGLIIVALSQTIVHFVLNNIDTNSSNIPSNTSPGSSCPNGQKIC